MRNLFTSLVLALGFATPALSASAAVMDPHLLYINGVISTGTLAPVRKALQDLVSDGYDGTVTLVISSPGGEVLSGVSFINLMQAAKAGGMTIDCYVLDMAASMAFQIFTQCSNRHALQGSFLLWHGVRTGFMGTLTARAARGIAAQMDQMDDLIRTQLTEVLGTDMDPLEIERNFQDETLWTGLKLAQMAPHFVEAEIAFPGLLVRLPHAYSSAAERNPFGLDKLMTPPTLYYIWGPYLPVIGGN